MKRSNRRSKQLFKKKGVSRYRLRFPKDSIARWLKKCSKKCSLLPSTITRKNKMILTKKKERAAIYVVQLN